MLAYRLISSDDHVYEPRDMWTTRMEPRHRDRSPRISSLDDGDWWVCDGIRGQDTGSGSQVGLRFEEPEKLSRHDRYENVRPGGFIPEEHVKDMDIDGVDVSVMYPTAGLIWYSVPDSELLTAICDTYNGWIAEFCQSNPSRLKAIGTINVDDVEEGCAELERIAKLGMVGAFIPVYPLPDRPYRDPIYDRLWSTVQDLDLPLLLHIATNRGGIPGCEFTMDLNDLTAAGRSTTDHWVRYSLTAMIFAGVFDQYPKLQVATVEHEMAWIPHWLKQMDFTYEERPVFTQGWKSKEGMLPSDYWRRNMFVEFMEDDIGLQLRHIIGVDNMIWGNDFPHSESTWPHSMEFLDRALGDATDEERRKIISGNAAKMFKFDVT